MSGKIWGEKPAPMLHGVSLETYDAEELNSYFERLKIYYSDVEKQAEIYRFLFGDEGIKVANLNKLQIKCLEAEIISTKIHEWKEKAEKWDNLYKTDPDATIDIFEEFNKAIEELNEARNKIAAAKAWKQGIFMKIPFVGGPGNITKHDLNRLDEILEESE